MTRVRLLAENMLAGLEGAHRPLVVERSGERDYDRIDCVVGEQRVVRGMGALDPVLACERLRPGEVARRDCDHRALLAGRTEVGALNVRGGEETEPNHLSTSIMACVRAVAAARHPRRPGRRLPATPPNPASGGGGDLAGGTVYGGGHVPMIIIQRIGVRGATDDTATNHYSLLQTIEQNWNLPLLGNASDLVQVRPLTGLLK